MTQDGRSISLWDEETDELFDMLKTTSPATTPTPGSSFLSSSSGRSGPLRSESLFPASPLTDTTTPVSRVLSGAPVLGPLRLASLAAGDDDDDILDSIDSETIRIWPENKPRAVFSSDLKVTTAAPTLTTTTDDDRTSPNSTRGDEVDDETLPVLQPTSSLLTPFVFSFEEVFTGGDWYSRLRRKALAGELGTTQFAFRAIAWRLFLGVFDRNQSPAEWLAQAEHQRQHYTELLAKHYVVDPQSHSDDDPLSQNESSVWKKYFQNSQLESTINTDIPRTYPENDFFQSPVVQKQMLRPLFLWSVLNPRTSYRQGMHEILAPIIYLLHRHSVDVPEESDIAGQLSHRKFVEHDSYWMFSAVMEHAATWFNNNSVSSPNLSDDVNGSSSSPPVSTVVAKCKYIQETLLKKFDPQLSGFLNDLEITPHLYGIRWVRILLGREFHLEDILSVWDALFSYDGNLGLLDFICVAMLMFIRENLLQLDFNGAMKRLFKFPPVENATIFIERAIDLKEGKLHVAQAPPPSAPIVLEGNDPSDPLASASASASATASPLQPRPPAVSTGSTTTSTAARTSSEGKAGTGKRILQFVKGSQPATAAATPAQAPAVDLPSRITSLETEVETLKTTQRHMASRLERIAFVLQQEFSKPPDQMEMDLLVLALAELKQVKDIGYGEIIVAQALDIFQGSVSFPIPQSK